ncbi:hypothetical protein EG329_004976 [Mollisiaceae sp. DMI_Dod_QoI]|nr:hypothetical protein EG329_004976 [Helotiales sp. DMI_Dod_QoI]
MNLPTTSADDSMAGSSRAWQDMSSSFTAHITVSLSGPQQVHTMTSGSDNLPNRPKEEVTQEFAFVNSTAPGRNRDPEVRKLVRGHVVRDSSRRKKLQRQQQVSSFENVQPRQQPRQQLSQQARDVVNEGETYDSAGCISLNAEQATTAISRRYFESAPSFPTQGMDPHPYLSPYLYRITALGEAMYPLVSSFRFNPISPATWFDCALRDEALFHAILYVTCTYADLITGAGENPEAIQHVGKSVSLVKERLDQIIQIGRRPEFEFVEMTVRTVSCLAITEAIKGNRDGWKIHMAGLKQMVDLKGGLTNFGVTIQLKLHRADLLGAVDYREETFLERDNSLPSIPSRHSLPERGEECTDMLTLLNTLPISDELHDALAYMHSLSIVVSRILESSRVSSGAQQVSWQKQSYALRYMLLSGLGRCDDQDEERRFLDETLRIGALLYVQATPQEFPFSAVGPAKLITRLKELVLMIQMWNEREGNLVMWLLFMGGISARKGEDKVWFVAQLEKLTARLRILEWDVLRGRLQTLWWVGPVHEKPCKTLWDEVLGLRTVIGIHGSAT